MDTGYSIRKTFRKWYARNYIEILDSVVMFYIGMLLLIGVYAVLGYFKIL
jgi:hypothetical protein